MVLNVDGRLNLLVQIRNMMVLYFNEIPKETNIII